MTKRSDRPFHRILKNIDARIQARLHSQDNFVNELLQYAALTKGKQLRIQLTLLAAQIGGKVDEKTESLAAAMELFHHATLMHDDVIDKAGQRRHCPSMNAQYGNELAVLAGDYLFTQVMQILFEDVPDKVRAYVVAAAGKVCLGEIQERQTRRAVNMTTEKYREIVENKTASLFAACCQGGAIMGGVQTRQAKWLGNFGMAYGMAFQIQDDILDLTGRSQKTGKPIGQDLREGRVTLPVILGLQRLKGAERKSLVRAVQTGTFRIAAVKKSLLDNGLIGEAQAIAEMFIASARTCLDRFPVSKPIRQLQAMVDEVARRDS